ncbi:uncharacterized protein LOC130168067 [Seriola aureovittata]|uniref:uncharacterized protein LOC130168067 n=1 Tax=Seriola aureovittata TaxID=2871759 RepID=UPI0024BEADE3|nr:uncharacterized protein LOC130168067 [Seriola aureovittata]
MEGELQEMRDLVAQLRAENDRLQREQVAAVPGPSAAPPISTEPLPAPSTSSAPVTERLVLIPRDRKCPVFRGRTGLGLEGWIEEVQACMRARHLSLSDQAFFLFDHLEGEPREEIKYRSSAERSDPARIIAVLRELYGCTDSYVALQEAFFSRRQQEGETLQEFSLALMSLMASVRQSAPSDMLNADVLLRDQFVESVIDGSLRRELKQLVRRQPAVSLLEARAEAIRWEREGLPGGVRGRSHSVPSVLGLQYGVQSAPPVANRPQAGELLEVKEMLMRQQEQLNRLTDSLAQLQTNQQRNHSTYRGPVICRRCQQPGHFARECEGGRALPRPRPLAPASSQLGMQHNSGQHPGN